MQRDGGSLHVRAASLPLWPFNSIFCRAARPSLPRWPLFVMLASLMFIWPNFLLQRVAEQEFLNVLSFSWKVSWWHNKGLESLARKLRETSRKPLWERSALWQSSSHTMDHLCGLASAQATAGFPAMHVLLGHGSSFPQTNSALKNDINFLELLIFSM